MCVALERQRGGSKVFSRSYKKTTSTGSVYIFSSRQNYPWRENIHTKCWGSFLGRPWGRWRAFSFSL